MSTPAQRVSDAERDAVADRLRAAAAEGRLDADELEARLEAAYGARTRGELEPLTADLPTDPPPRSAIWSSQPVRRQLAAFLTASLICVAVWLATGADGHFWPVWVMLGTGIPLVAAWIRAALGVEDEPPPEGPQLPQPPRP